MKPGIKLIVRLRPPAANDPAENADCEPAGPAVIAKPGAIA
jgi:hypothetical protein